MTERKLRVSPSGPIASEGAFLITSVAFPTILSEDTQDTTVALTGAEVGDLVSANIVQTDEPATVMLGAAKVTTADVVSLRYANVGTQDVVTFTRDVALELVKG